jgi:hypothetical protein
MNQFYKYSDINCPRMQVTGRSIDHILYNPYHINEEDFDKYICGDGGGDNLAEIYTHAQGLWPCVESYMLHWKE